MVNESLPPSQRLPQSITGRFILQSVRRNMNTGKGAAVVVGPGGRYVLDHPLGRGSMGVVYLARDTTLERDVALKVVSAPDHDPETLHRLLLREARALAKVHHPNVVEIYDVVSADFGELFLTMLYIPGQSLAEWQRQHSLRAVVHKYIAAGRGLAAAHDAGVVHRDFKPSNVIVDGNGERVVVIDFGLARAREQARTEIDGLSRTSALSEHGSTNTAVVGTLPYVAPEVVDGAAATPASDQYAFCVAFWQGVTGELPFGGEPREVGSPPPSRTRSMPSWLYRALCCGFAADPGARFSTIAELTAALERGMGRRQRLGLAAVALGVVAVVGGTLDLRQPSASPTCASVAAPMDRVWNEDARERVRRALADVDSERVRVTAFAIEVFETSAQQWRDASVASCEAQAREPESHRAMNQRACIDARLAYFEDALAQLEQLGPRSVPFIYKLLEPLTQVGKRCALPHPIVHERTWRALVEIGFAQTQRNYERALELAIHEAEQTRGYAERCVDDGDSSVERGELLFEIARIHSEAENPTQALIYLDRVDIDAIDCGHRELLARSNILRAQIQALDLADAESAQRSLDAGVAGYRQLGGFGTQEQEVHEARAFLALARGLPLEAIEHYQAAIESLPDDLAARPREAKLLVNIGAALHELGEYEEAERSYEQAIVCVSKALGPGHPESRARRARVAYNLGLAAIGRGDEARGEALIAQLEGLAEPVLALQVHTSLLLHIIDDKARLDDARARADVLAAALERAESLPTRVRAAADTSVGQVFARDGDPRGLIHLRRALNSWEQLPDASFSRDVCELNYAEALADAGRSEEAKQHLLALLARFDGETLPVIRSAAVRLAGRLQLPLSLDGESELSTTPGDRGGR